MKVETFSILAGSEACNARCPFCVSKMTPPQGVLLEEPTVNWHRFHIACRLAKAQNAITAMFTGKGEPTLFPDQITRYLEEMRRYEFPLIEIQTNGIKFAERSEKYDPYLRSWCNLGMTTIAISIVHYEPEKNREVYLPYKKEYIDLPELIKKLHEIGLSVRLTCIGANGFVDSAEKLKNLVAFAKTHQVDQLTFTPVNKPVVMSNREAWEWTNEHHLKVEQRKEIREFVTNSGCRLRVLAHGAEVFDLFGQNLCLNECLTVQPNAEEMRNLIFFPDGKLKFDWQYEGATIL